MSRCVLSLASVVRPAKRVTVVVCVGRRLRNKSPCTPSTLSLFGVTRRMLRRALVINRARASVATMSKRAREASTSAPLYGQGFTLPQIRGPDLAIDSLKGKVALILNTASH